MGSSRSISKIFEEMMSELILFDPENTQELKNLQALIDALEKEIPEEYHQQLVEKFESLSSSEGPNKSIEESIQDFQESVQSLMQYHEQGHQGDESSPAADESEEEAEDSLPEYLEDPTLLEDFLEEAEEHLQSAEKHLIDLEDDRKNLELIDAIFRPFHTIKGIAGFLALGDIEEIAHVYEDSLDEARNGKVDISTEMIDAILKAIDAIREIMHALEKSLETGSPAEHSVDINKVLNKIRTADNQETEPAEANTAEAEVQPGEEDAASEIPETVDEPVATADEPVDTKIESADVEQKAGDSEEQTETEADSNKDFDEDSMMDALQDPDLLQDFLQESEEYIASVEQNLIEWENDPDNLEIVDDIFRPFHTIKGVAGFLNLSEIEALSHEFENLLDKAREGKIKLQPAITDLILEGIDALRAMMDALHSSLEEGKVVPHNVDTEPLIMESIAFQKGEAPTESDKQNQEVSAEDEQTEEELNAQTVAKMHRRKTSSVIKVDIEKMDHLIDMVGELVIVQNMVSQNQVIRSSSDKRLLADVAQLKRITSTLQDISMSLRMVPIEATFRKMQRIVRDLSHKSGKEIDLKLSGEQTEIDRNMVETLYDPLVHMIRNSCDHGIEMPDTRAAEGKARNGTIHLNAYHRGGNVVIEIADDGAGLDKNAILKKAMERGLVQSEEELSDKQVYELLFHPGFSTAQKVTEVSGRGVGMDVVKRTVEKMRGQIDIETEQGKGTTFYIRLPLTLAIIDGVIVRVGSERFVIPTLSIEESVQIDKKHYNYIAGRGETIMVRDHIFPLIRLHHLFNVNTAVENPWEGIIMLVDLGGEGAGILVDELIDKQEVVIKSMGEHFQTVPGISGGAILGDGSVGLILDVPNLLVVRDEKRREDEISHNGQNGNGQKTKLEEAE